MAGGEHHKRPGMDRADEPVGLEHRVLFRSAMGAAGYPHGMARGVLLPQGHTTCHGVRRQREIELQIARDVGAICRRAESAEALGVSFPLRGDHDASCNGLLEQGAETPVAVGGTVR